MEKNHSRWGPHISCYINTYGNRIHQAYDDYLNEREIVSIAHDGMAPLPILESTLAVSENMHKEGFQHGEKSIPVIMHAIRRYMEPHEHDTFPHIFNYYYGFLCIRHLMRMVCIGTLMENSTLERFLNSLDPEEDPLQITIKLAERSIDLMHDSLVTRNRLKIIGALGMLSSQTLNAFPMLGGLNFNDVGFLITVLWKDRRSITTIGKRGLLPGLGVLLFVLCEMLTSNPHKRNFECWVEMQELMVRYYLVASSPERAILRQLTRFIGQTMLRDGLDTEYPKYQEDAREMIQAYSDMMFSPNSPNLAQVMLLDMAYVLFQFIHSLCTPRVEDSVPAAVRAGLERLWLECDRERHELMAPNRRGFTRQFSQFMFVRLKLIREDLQTKSGRMAFADALLVDSNIVGLAGRVLLMMAMDDKEPDMWSAITQGLDELYELLAATFSTGVPNSVLAATAVEWNKVLNQLYQIRDGNAPSKVSLSCVEEAIKLWQPLGPVQQDSEFCSYPRCPVVTIEVKSQESKFMCSRCCVVKYCSEICQMRHWRTGNSDSHQSNCVQLKSAEPGVLKRGAEPRRFCFEFSVPVSTLKERSDFQRLPRF